MVPSAVNISSPVTSSTSIDVSDHYIATSQRFVNYLPLKDRLEVIKNHTKSIYR
jgi:hypothetical protein